MTQGARRESGVAAFVAALEEFVDPAHRSSDARVIGLVPVPGIVALLLVAAVWLALHAYELIWWREERARRRAS